MKRTIAGILLMVGLGAGSLFAEDGYWQDRRHIQRDQQQIAQDRRELHRDLYYGNYRGAEHERRELDRRYRDLHRDYDRDAYRDRYRDYNRYDGDRYGYNR